MIEAGIAMRNSTDRLIYAGKDSSLFFSGKDGAYVLADGNPANDLVSYSNYAQGHVRPRWIKVIGSTDGGLWFSSDDDGLWYLSPRWKAFFL